MPHQGSTGFHQEPLARTLPGRVGRLELYETHEAAQSGGTVVTRVKSGSLIGDMCEGHINGINALRGSGLTSLIPLHDYIEGDEHFVVTENLREHVSPCQASRVFNSAPRLAAELIKWLDMLDAIHRQFPAQKSIELSPVTVVVFADSSVRLLFYGALSEIGTGERSPALDDADALSFAPLEQIWPDLDSASQKAISRLYDETALQILESPSDVRSDIYALGAIFYRLATGANPPSSLERSIEILDDHRDPLTLSAALDAGLAAESANFFLKAMALRREDRFQSLDDARSSLGAATPASSEDFAWDDAELLEIPPVQTTPFVAAWTKDVPVEKNAARGESASNENRAHLSDQNNASPGGELFAEHKAATTGGARIFAVTAVLLIVAGITAAALFIYQSGNRTETLPAVVRSEPSVPAPATQASNIAAVNSPTSTTAPISEPAPATEVGTAEFLAPAGRSAPPDRPVKKKVASPKPAPASKPQKAVTVDDLIRDN